MTRVHIQDRFRIEIIFLCWVLSFQFLGSSRISFFGNSINIPAISMGNATQPTYLKDLPIPGDKMEFEDLNVRFLVDENLENYMEIQNWMRGLGFPERPPRNLRSSGSEKFRVCSEN